MFCANFIHGLVWPYDLLYVAEIIAIRRLTLLTLSESLSDGMNRLHVLLGLLGLLCGTLVYLADRPPEQAYFIYTSVIDVSLYKTLPQLFGVIGNNLPSFFHVFSFILLTAGLCSCRKRGYFIICASWLLVDCLFELGQKYHALAIGFIPHWFERIPYLENTANYFRLGTFDVLDVVAIILGSMTAYFILILTTKGGRGNEETRGV